MKIRSIRLVGIRCFEDTGPIMLGPKCNLFVGQNNSGKSTLLRAVTAFQGFPFGSEDIRPDALRASHEMAIEEIKQEDYVRFLTPDMKRTGVAYFIRPLRGEPLFPPDEMIKIPVSDDGGAFNKVRPAHSVIPFLARRKAMEFDENINSNNQDQVRGTYANLYSRIDLLATVGHPRHADFQQTVSEVIGLQITTKASPKGKTAGFYLDQDHFVTLDRMGDGVTEMVGLILELCLERNKIFVLEEPETNLHPKGLKALMGLVRSAAATNQFIVATHSNIVVRELGSDDATKVFRVYRNEPDPLSPSGVEEISKTPTARMALLRELGYEFADLELHEGLALS